MGARFTKEQAEKLTIIENRVRTRPTKAEIQTRLELEKLQERVKMASPPKRSKYGNRKTVVGKRVFDSKKEANRFIELLGMEVSGQITDLTCQIPYEFIYNGVKIASYVADFAYLKKDGQAVVEDVKGFKGGSAYAIFRLKKKMMAAFHGIEVTEI